MNAYGLTTTIETITPTLAAAYLERNVVNRKLRNVTVRRYARDMKSGDWQLTHQGIAFNQAGMLVDGQHRLAAIVQSGCTIAIAVTRGIQAENALGLHVDAGAGRSASDIIGVKSEIVAPCSFLHRLAAGEAPTKSESAKAVAEFGSDVERIVSAGTGARRKGITSAQVIAAAAVTDAMTGGDYARQSFARLVRLDFEHMTRIEMCWMRAIQCGSSYTSRANELFGRALSIFDQTNANGSKVYQSAARIEAAQAYVKSRVKK